MLVSIIHASHLVHVQHSLIELQASDSLLQERINEIGKTTLKRSSLDTTFGCKPITLASSRFTRGMHKLIALGRNSITHLDMCYAFNIQDVGPAAIGVDTYKGITTIGTYHSILLSEEDNEKINRDIIVFTEYFDKSPGIVFYSLSKKHLYFFKKEESQLKFCMQSPLKQLDWEWVRLDNDQLRSLDLQDEDWLIDLGPEKITDWDDVFYKDETPENPIKGHFFSQSQMQVNEDNACGAHSINAFFGKKVTTLGDQFDFLLKTIKAEDYDMLANIYKINGILDINKGTMETFLVNYLNYSTISVDLPVFKNFRFFTVMREEQMDEGFVKELPLLKDLHSLLPPKCDRLIVGLKQHFVALRKNKERNTWHVIDSLCKESQDKAYDTPTKAIEENGRLGLFISIIYSDSVELEFYNFTSHLRPFREYNKTLSIK